MADCERHIIHIDGLPCPINQINILVYITVCMNSESGGKQIQKKKQIWKNFAIAQVESVNLRMVFGALTRSSKWQTSQIHPAFSANLFLFAIRSRSLADHLHVETFAIHFLFLLPFYHRRQYSRVVVISMHNRKSYNINILYVYHTNN